MTDGVLALGDGDQSNVVQVYPVELIVLGAEVRLLAILIALDDVMRAVRQHTRRGVRGMVRECRSPGIDLGEKGTDALTGFARPRSDRRVRERAIFGATRYVHATGR